MGWKCGWKQRASGGPLREGPLLGLCRAQDCQVWGLRQGGQGVCVNGRGARGELQPFIFLFNMKDNCSLAPASCARRNIKSEINTDFN